MNIPRREYTHDSFLNEIRTSRISGTFNVICFYVNLTIYNEKEDFLPLFMHGNNKLENMGDIDMLTMNAFYYNMPKEVTYYLYFDKENSILLAYTQANRSDLDQTLYRVLKRSFGTYYLPINFTAFFKLTTYLENNFDRMKITYFSAFHHPKFKTRGLHRPDVRRSIQYYGDDGLKTIEEMKEYYGMLPRTIEYDIEEYGKYRVNNEGRFSFMSGHDNVPSWEIFYDIINYVLKDILLYKKIIEKSEYKILPYSTDEKTFYLPTATPWIMNFGNELGDKDLDILLDMLSNNDFTLYNTSKVYGESFTLSSMIYDEMKNNKFSLHIDNDKVIIIPYEKNILESFIKIYEVISDFDPESEIRDDING